MQGKVKKILLHIYSAVLLFLASSWYVFAGTGSECYIESSSAGSYTIFINTPPYSVATQQVTTPYEISDAATDVPIVLRVMELHVKPYQMAMRVYIFLIPLMPI
ncbi:fimbrial protein [Escherichia coli]|nr:fimbrial protein [Escherichia coli]